MGPVIGTRGSRLALVQAHWVADQLRKEGLNPEIKIIKTKGDVVQDRFDKMEGKGFFTKEIEEALLHKDIDLAVHCLKDLPTTNTPGLCIGAIPKREDPRDVIVSTQPLAFNDAGPVLAGLRVGTSSNRRVAGLKVHAPTATFVPIRGNVPKRMEKTQTGEVDVAVLALAGLNRLQLELEPFTVTTLSPDFLTPAPGQGALALQIREGESNILSNLHHQPTAECVTAERQVLAHLDGGCQLPLGVLVEPVTLGFRMRLFLGPREAGETASHHDFAQPSLTALVDKAIALLK